MVKGIETFREHFSRFNDRYVTIGGTACDLAFNAIGEEFRATRDLDIVVLANRLNEDFANSFLEFVKSGGYRHTRHSNESEVTQLYRFVKPENDEFPTMIELFSRQPDLLRPISEGQLTPLPVPVEGQTTALSLSAILMDESYY